MNFTDSTCNPSRFAAEPFNEDGEAVFHAVRDSIKKNRVDVNDVIVYYSSDRIISPADLAVTVIGTKSYVYRRNGSPPPPERSDITQIEQPLVLRGRPRLK